MNRISFIFLFFIATHAIGQGRDTAHILLRTGHCRPTPYTNPNIPDTIRLFKQPENILITMVHTRRQHKHPIPLTLPKGNYRLTYRNIYGQVVDKKCSLYEDTVTELALCPDSLTAYPENTLAKLKSKENLIITYQSIGCFHNILERLILTRNNDHIQARLYGDTTEYYLKGDSVRYRDRRNVLIGRKILTPDDSLAFIGFENELRMAQRAYCTTQEYYSIRSKYWTCQIRNGNCSWPGFFVLKTAWFGQPDPDRIIPFSGRRAPDWSMNRTRLHTAD